MILETDRRKKLAELGSEALADALLELAVRIDAADDMVERLIATPNENIRRYKAKLADLKRGRRFIPWDESAAFAHELEMLLADLKSGVDDPRTGGELMAAFYRTDGAVFEECDDSNGTVSDVFLFDAKELFVSYASKCRNKQWLSGLIFDLNFPFLGNFSCRSGASGCGRNLSAGPHRPARQGLGGLLTLAEAMEGSARRLCASILFRAPLDSILRRAQYKAYAHGGHHLKRLDQLSISVSDWRGLENHRQKRVTLSGHPG